MSMAYPIFNSLVLLFIVVVLLRQLNRERDERREMMERYRELALRVRRTQMAVENDWSAAQYGPWSNVHGATETPTRDPLDAARGSTITTEDGSEGGDL